MLIVSCAKDIVDLTGDIQGSVKDYDSGKLIENCRVSLSPGGKSASTDANGAFSFEDLEAGTYTLSFSKSGYGDATQDVSVVTGQTSNVNVFLKLPSATTGKIAGTIKDYQNGQLISNCNVSITPSGKSVTSSSSGTFEFSDLTPGQYSVSFTKSGYDDESTTVTVTAGKTTTADALLKAKASFALSDTSYDFGDLEVSKTFYFFNYSDADCSFTVLNVPAWLTFDKNNGTVKASSNEAVTASVDRSKVSEGAYSQNITVSYSGKVSGSATLSLKMKKVVLTSPTVSIATSAENVKQNAFDISGSITATGGSQIISYGHCWNTSGNPTISDNKTDLGTTNAICSFKSTAENLNTYTTYYVRAYAKNAQGITYSDQIAVTTQDVASDKWDGNIASSFAGGSGTYVDPYIIKTGGQLLLAKNYSDKYFELGGNIDLNNKNWLPFEFKGTLDGKGFQISNLFINRIDDYQGLFSKCSGTVKNLTIKGVKINAPTSNKIGALSGSGGTFYNCKVILLNDSVIQGKQDVGGISGANIIISHSSVEGKNILIKGETSVGGIVGVSSIDNTLADNTCNASIYGSSFIGGIIGTLSDDGVFVVKNCSFSGEISGEECIGGIIGGVAPSGMYQHNFDIKVEGCKVDAKLKATKGNCGGIIGDIPDVSGSYSIGFVIIGSYAKGQIEGPAQVGGIAGVEKKGSSSSTFRRVNVYLSYSTMTSTSTGFYGLGKFTKCVDCATTYEKLSDETCQNCTTNCNDISSFLRESYSQYASYWNFNKSWVWEGNISGSSVKVNCPNLSWE